LLSHERLLSRKYFEVLCRARHAQDDSRGSYSESKTAAATPPERASLRTF
jgi:hypothetical protein